MDDTSAPTNSNEPQIQKHLSDDDDTENAAESVEKEDRISKNVIFEKEESPNDTTVIFKLEHALSIKRNPSKKSETVVEPLKKVPSVYNTSIKQRIPENLHLGLLQSIL